MGEIKVTSSPNPQEHTVHGLVHTDRSILVTDFYLHVTTKTLGNTNGQNRNNDTEYSKSVMAVKLLDNIQADPDRILNFRSDMPICKRC